jgi:hypothetical protein
MSHVEREEVRPALGEFLEPAPHLWQVGLASPVGRRCFTAVVPAAVDLSGVVSYVAASLPTSVSTAVRFVPAAGYAHLTLNVSDVEHLPLGDLSGVTPFRWRATALEVTAYSLRLAVDAPGWAELCAAAGVEPLGVHITLGYVLRRAPRPSQAELVRAGRLLPGGVADRVELRMFDATCPPLQPHLAATVKLTGADRAGRVAARLAL